MEVERTDARDETAWPRIYIAAIRLANFRGHKHVEAHLFRLGAKDDELEELRRLDNERAIVGAPDPAMPPELATGLTRESALACVLEAFTKSECDQIIEYLGKRYADQIETLVICPIELPVPFGVGPLAEIPAGSKSGFINFDEARGYGLPFRMKAYYELGNS